MIRSNLPCFDASRCVRPSLLRGALVLSLILVSVAPARADEPATPANPLEFAPRAPAPGEPAPIQSESEAEFFLRNAQQPGVQVLPSGAQAVRTRVGQGAAARGSELVVMNISRHGLREGAAGPEKSRHEQRYVTQQLPRELYEAVQLMQEGDQWEVYVPAHPAKKRRNGRPAHAGQPASAFTIELLSAH